MNEGDNEKNADVIWGDQRDVYDWKRGVWMKM